MNASEFNKTIRAQVSGLPIDIQTHPLAYQNGNYDFLKIVSRAIRPNDKIVLMRAGIHGDEVSGPLTFFNHISSILDAIHGAGLKAIIYPLGNPSGFEHGLRYNVDNDNGDAGNGDFMRYELPDGKITDDLGASNEFKQWFWSSDEQFHVHLPLETRLMHTLLKQDPLQQVVVAFDLHQDYITQDAAPSAYHYSFGDLSPYFPIVEQIAQVVPVLKHTPIGAGFHTAVGERGEVAHTVAETELIATDEHGFIVRHDGSMPDLLYRIGAPYCVTSETMGSTPAEKAIQVNLCWVEGLLKLARDYHE